MKSKLIALFTVAFAFAAMAADVGPSPTSPAYPRDGVWKPVTAALAGTNLPKLALKAITLRITGASYEVTVIGENHSDKGNHTLDVSTTPNRITIQSTDGPNKGKTFLGIYEVKDADALRVCYDLTGTAFPAKFESTVENGYYLVEYRRAQEKAPAPPTNAAEDAQRQNGTWKPAGAMLGGKKLAAEELAKIRLTIKDGAYEVNAGGGLPADKGTLSLDTSVTPKRMTIRGVEGPNKGKTILAIYQMGETDGSVETFRVCYDLSGKAFPTDFKSPKDSALYLVGYRRQPSP
jgi:uncharacterized protein (TIGR03067 family)